MRKHQNYTLTIRFHFIGMLGTNASDRHSDSALCPIHPCSPSFSSISHYIHGCTVPVSWCTRSGWPKVELSFKDNTDAMNIHRLESQKQNARRHRSIHPRTIVRTGKSKAARPENQISCHRVLHEPKQKSKPEQRTQSKAGATVLTMLGFSLTKAVLNR